MTNDIRGITRPVAEAVMQAIAFDDRGDMLVAANTALACGAQALLEAIGPAATVVSLRTLADQIARETQ
jgi:hypothetical protein